MRKTGCGPWRVFNRLINPRNKRSRVTLFWLFVVAAGLVITVFSVGVIFHDNKDTLGPVGDFIGGILNPLLTFLTFMGLLITIVLQQQELSDTRRELKRSAIALEGQQAALDKQLSALAIQNFESTFFQMLTLHNTIVNSMDIKSETGAMLRGRDCFRHFCDKLATLYEGANPERDVLHRIRTAHMLLWRECGHDLGHYYRYLYNIVRLVDESKVDKVQYIRILRAQISDSELLLMFYNGLTEQGEKFKVFMERYALLDNLPNAGLLEISHRTLYDAKAFNEDESIRNAAKELKEKLFSHVSREVTQEFLNMLNIEAPEIFNKIRNMNASLKKHDFSRSNKIPTKDE